MGGISIQQLLIIAVIAILLLGTKKLGSIGSNLGASIEGFKKAMSDDKPGQDKTGQGANFTTKTIADRQVDMNQKQAKIEDAKCHDREQVQSMFDVGFGEPLLMFIIGLVVLGPQRLPVTVKTAAGWIHALRSLVTMAQNELTQGLKLQEFQGSLEKIEKMSLTNLTSGLRASMDKLRRAAESMRHSYVANDPEEASDKAHTTHNPVARDDETAYEDVTSAVAQTQASSPEQKPETAPELVAKPATDTEPKAAAPSLSSSDKP